MRFCSKLIVLVLTVSQGFAQLTADQKVSDFQALAALYDKRYGPYEWKVSALGYDLLNIGPWLDQVRATKNDLDFYELMVNYVASLNDAHSYYALPANFVANLNFTVDIYDGKLLVDFINRVRLPAAEFQFLDGYELVSIDAQDAQKVLDGLLQYEIAANPRSTRRLAAQLLTFRPQSLMPHAADVPEISTVVFRRPDGNLEIYRIPWTRSGLALTTPGTYTTPKSEVASAESLSITVGAPIRGRPGIPPRIGSDPQNAPPDYLQVFSRLWNCRLPDKAVNGFGALAPIFAASLPPDFTQRLGKSAADPFYSGVFTASGRKIGFIRIPSFSPTNQTTALTAFQTEMAYFQANTDGLVVDAMRNPGGSVAYLNAIVSLLMPSRWSSLGFELRATSEWVVSISSSIVSAKAQGAPQSTIDLLQKIEDAITAANHEVRGRTVPIPLDDVTIDRDPAMDSKGNVIAYTKPLMILGDELSASAAEAFVATIQDNARGSFFGWRTMGAGGNVETWEAGSYSLGSASVTESLMHRNHTIVTSDYPPAPYVENIGVRPDIVADYMTHDNLVQNGKPFVDAWVAAIVAQIQKGK